jgi:hypothetical protein
MLVAGLLWCRKKRKFTVERGKLVVVVSITSEEMGLQRCWVVINHDVGEVVVVEEAKVMAVEETRERLGTGKKKIRGDDFLSTLDPDFYFLNAWNPPLFIEVEEEDFVFTGAKYWPLIRTGRISTIDSKLPS